MNQFEPTPHNNGRAEAPSFPPGIDLDAIIASAPLPTEEDLIASREARAKLEASADMSNRITEREDSTRQ